MLGLQSALVSLLFILADGALEVDVASGGRRGVDESIPVIEIRGEGKPMSAAQIRHLEEISNGGPLDIKVEKTFVPAKCVAAAKRKDFVSFHYKAFTEDGKKVDQTYGVGPVTIQLGTGMVIPGLDKGLRGMCSGELRKIQVPYRLSRKAKSRVWKNIPNDEHWLTFDVEMIHVQPYSEDGQFSFLDMNNDTRLDQNEVVGWLQRMKKEYGKSWKNEDIDNVSAAKYYIKYFDVNGDGKVEKREWLVVMRRDEDLMASRTDLSSKEKGRRRDPGVAWILDFNNDGVVSYKEVDEADELIEKGPTLLPIFKDEL
ncbi:unnamed protein product [Caenorhabditis auriculariae]|uniref:peptidylprolyl isomerase n=1 Tax=Caenorhabditis auriculariae TaxID=2777116 RepID=A0A8S1HHV1_9PELO|nr:unnamed protein product [Caenorhabditis auriculariae]